MCVCAGGVLGCVRFMTATPFGRLPHRRGTQKQGLPAARHTVHVATVARLARFAAAAPSLFLVSMLMNMA